MVDSVAKTLGAGSGIDIGALVTSLVDAQFEAKTAAFTKREETLTAQVSAVANLKSGITGFNTALQSLVRGGTLRNQPSSSNTGIVQVSMLANATVKDLNSSIEVRSLAASQVAVTATPIAAGTRIGTGTLQFSFADGTAIAPITIDEASSSLTGIAAKINAAKNGITAQVVKDSTGERLVMKGASGVAKAFTLTGTDGDGGLAQLNVGNGATGTTIASAASDARIAVDGVEVLRSSNTVSDLIPGLRLDLQAAQPGTKVTLGNTPPTAAQAQAVSDFVETYNQLHTILKDATDPVSGPLARDSAARDMMRKLGQLTTVDLTGATDGSPTSLGALGVVTNKDGTLSLDSAKLSKAMAAYPAAIDAMFKDSAIATKNGLSGALNAITTQVTSNLTGLGASAASYQKAQSKLADDKLRLTDDETRVRTRLTQQFASMDAKVAVYKSTQAFMEQQIAAWNAG